MSGIGRSTNRTSRDLHLLLDAQQRIVELEAALAARDAQIAALLAQVEVLTRHVAELTEKLAQNSRNSHLPPSSDPPGSAGKAGHGRWTAGRSVGHT